MSKKSLISIGILVFLILSCFLIWKHFDSNKTNTTDASRFASEYTKVSKNNVFVYASASKVIDVLENGTGVVYLGFPECPWCQAYVKYLNEAAIENEVDTIYYYNIMNDRSNNTENYKKIVSLLSEYLMNDDEGNKRIYVPNVTFVKDGEIIGNDHETSVVTESDGTPEQYWTEEKINALKTKLTPLLNGSKETVCTSCN